MLFAIPLTTLDLPVPDGAPPIDAASLINQVMTMAPPGRGWSTPEVFQCIKVMAAIDAAVAAKKDVALLEPSLHQHLKSAVEGFRWGIANRAIADFVTSIRDAREIDPNASVMVEAPNA